MKFTNNIFDAKVSYSRLNCKNRGVTLLLLVLMQLPLLIFAQSTDDNFLNPAATEPTGLSVIQTSKLNGIKQNKLHKSVQFIKIGNFSKIVSSNKGSLPIQIPGMNRKYIARPVESQFYSDQDFTWFGKINNDNGQVIIVCKNGEIFGHISIDDKTFEIQAIDKENNILIEYDPVEMSKYKCGFENSKSASQQENVPLNDAKEVKSVLAVNTQANVRILVLYTPKANTAVSNISSTATLAISQLNGAFLNSNINSNVTATLAGVVALNFTESGDIGHDVTTLAGGPITQNLRNTYQADIVVLLTDGNYKDYYGNNTFGIVRDIGPNNSSAYAIVEADMATSDRYSFAHEVGHLFGGHHEDDNLNGSVGYDHGYYFKTGFWPFLTERFTMMHTIGNASRIMHYSNPDVEYKNKATGTSSNSNVARRIRETSPTVEAFRAYNPPLSVNIVGPTKGYNSGEYTWDAQVSNGIAPYTYQWEFSYDGINYNNFGSTSSVTAPLPYNYDLHLRLTVTSSTGQQAVDFHTTLNLGDDPNIPLEVALIQKTTSVSENNSNNAGQNELDNKGIRGIDWTIYPNPLTENSILSFYVNQATVVNVDILDIQGKGIKNITNQEYSKGFYTIKLPSIGLAPGTYLCRIRQGNQTSVKKLISK